MDNLLSVDSTMRRFVYMYLIKNWTPLIRYSKAVGKSLEKRLEERGGALACRLCSCEEKRSETKQTRTNIPLRDPWSL